MVTKSHSTALSGNQIAFQGLPMQSNGFFATYSKINSIFPLTYSKKALPLQSKTKSRGNSSVGRASASQAEGREFEPRLPLYNGIA